jgi:hypothetical protein
MYLMQNVNGEKQLSRAVFGPSELRGAYNSHCFAHHEDDTT